MRESVRRCAPQKADLRGREVVRADRRCTISKQLLRLQIERRGLQTQLAFADRMSLIC